MQTVMLVALLALVHRVVSTPGTCTLARLGPLHQMKAGLQIFGLRRHVGFRPAQPAVFRELTSDKIALHNHLLRITLITNSSRCRIHFRRHRMLVSSLYMHSNIMDINVKSFFHLQPVGCEHLPRSLAILRDN